ncbi:MAG: trypsin-like serine protease [Ignavibacteria bacterium]
MKIIKAAKWAMLASLIALVSLSGGVYAITGNYQADSTPYVGVVVLFSDVDGTVPIGYCSGVLLSPTVMLTAGHSTLGAKVVSVCFDKGPIDYEIQDGKIVYPGSEVVYTGKPVTYNEYAYSLLEASNGNQMYSTSDLGLIILDTPVDEVGDFPKLPSVGFVDTISAKTNLKEVGYGLQFQVTPKDNGLVNSWVGTLSCNEATAEFVSGNFAGSDKYLRLTANPSQGKGGVAFGDSGGPVLYGDGDSSIVLAVNAYVSNSNCAGVTYHTRIDTQQVLDLINSYLNKEST